MEKDWGQSQSKASIIYTKTALKVWLTQWSWPCWKTYGGPIKRAKRRMKNSSWLRTYVVKSRSEVSVRSCKESIAGCSVTCGVEYWDCKTVITTVSFPWRKQARSMISFRAAQLKTLVRSLRRGAVDHQPLIIYLWFFTVWLSIHKFFFLFEWPKNQPITSVEARYWGRNRCKVYPVYEKQGRAAGIYSEGFHLSELTDSRLHTSIKLCNRLWETLCTLQTN